MSTDLVLKMILSYFMIFCGVYLFISMIELIEDYLREKRLLHTLKRIETKVDQLPKGKIRTEEEIEEDWWFANR